MYGGGGGLITYICTSILLHLYLFYLYFFPGVEGPIACLFLWTSLRYSTCDSVGLIRC